MSIIVKKFHKKGVEYATTRVEPAGFLQPPAPVTRIHNKGKGKNVKSAAWDIVQHDNKQLLVLNKGHKYTVAVDDRKTKKHNASKQFIVIDITGFENLSVDASE